MKKILILLFLILIAAAVYVIKHPNKSSQPALINTMTQTEQSFNIVPIEHATVLLKWDGKVILVDPADSRLLTQQPAADIILITHAHPDHFSTSTLTAITAAKAKLITPQAVSDLLPENLKNQNITMVNGAAINIGDFKIEAVAAYNLPQTPQSFHPKGDGNGYVIEHNGKRIYFSGDTSATPEMKALQNIDIAFVCMNLPYTMTVEEAAEGVLAFKPKTVIPYHYKNADASFADLDKFKALVNGANSDIKVEIMNFYIKTIN